MVFGVSSVCLQDTDVECYMQHDSVLFLTGNCQSQLLGLPDEGTATKFCKSSWLSQHSQEAFIPFPAVEHSGNVPLPLSTMRRQHKKSYTQTAQNI